MIVAEPPPLAAVAERAERLQHPGRHESRGIPDVADLMPRKMTGANRHPMRNWHPGEHTSHGIGWWARS